MDANKYYKMTNPQYVNELSSVYSQMYNNTPQEVVEESCNDTAEVIEEQGRKHGSKHSSIGRDPGWAGLVNAYRDKKEREDRGPRHSSAENKIKYGGVERITAEDEGEETSDQYNKGFDAGYAKGYANGLAQSKG